MTTVLATVVIVNYNGADLLPACLDGLRKQDLPAEQFRTVVVDNASSDGSVELLRTGYPEVEVIASPQNLGFAGGNNLALKRLDTPYAVLLNNDAVPDPGWLEALLAPFGDPGGERIGATTGKTLFLPKFARLQFRTEGFSPGLIDRSPAGLRVAAVGVGPVSANGDHAAEGVKAEEVEDVTAKVVWDRVGRRPQDDPEGRFWWTPPEGEALVPIPGRLVGQALRVTLRVRAEDGATKPLHLAAGGKETAFDIGDRYRDVEICLPADEPLVDVINNAGNLVLKLGYGADRGFKEVDEGQFDIGEEVFGACGNGMAIRTSAGNEAGWFDDDFFMYYEDCDLSWRIRSRGWTILYVPGATLRHVHSASSTEWSERWLFHVDRNRLLMLVKEATPGLALEALVRYSLGAGRGVLSGLETAVRDRRRPSLRYPLLRGRVLVSFFCLLPRMLVRRRAIRRRAVVSAEALQEWMVSPPW